MHINLYQYVFYAFSCISRKIFSNLVFFILFFFCHLKFVMFKGQVHSKINLLSIEAEKQVSIVACSSIVHFNNNIISLNCCSLSSEMNFSFAFLLLVLARRRAINVTNGLFLFCFSSFRYNSITNTLIN